MSTVFVGGSRRLSRLPAGIPPRLERMIAQGCRVVVGDASGADRALQRYFLEQGYRRVEVFASGTRSRHNLGEWPERLIPVPRGTRGFAFFTAKDRAMAEAADFGLMLWDGGSLGTLVNVYRLVQRAKPVVLFDGPRDACIELRGARDWERFHAARPAELRHEVELKAGPAAIQPAEPERPRQHEMFDLESAPPPDAASRVRPQRRRRSLGTREAPAG